MQNNPVDDFFHWKRKTVLFLTSQCISLFGSSLVQFAIIWYVARTTDSGIMVTISSICGFLPQMLISLFAGVWADRHNRKWMIILSDGAIALSTLILAIAMVAGYKDLWMLFLISAVRSAGSGVQSPAVSALIPQIVPPGRLMKISGLNGSIQSLVFLASPAVGGAVLAYAEFYNILLIDLATAAIGIGMLLLLPIPSHAKAAEAQTANVLADLREGLKYAYDHRFIRKLLYFFVACSVLFVPAAFLNVLMVIRVFGGDYWHLTLNEMAFFVGSMLGSFLIAAWGGFKNRLTTLVFSCVLFGATMIGLGLATNFYVYLSIMVLTGISMPMFNSPIMVLVQEKVETDMQGRMFSLVQIVFASMMPFGMLFWGPLSDFIPIEHLMVVAGVLLCALSFVLPADKKLMKEGLPRFPKERQADDPKNQF